MSAITVNPAVSLKSDTLNIATDEYGLLTDLYQLTMGACYVQEGCDRKRASFELFVRRLPDGFGYLIAMGIAQAVEYLQNLRFTTQQIAALQATGIFENANQRFWELLKNFRFEGDLWAVPEGMAMFANEPFLRVEAPLWQAQLVETYLLNAINYQTLIATRAARMRDVAGDHLTLLEFGTRRAFSPQASLWAARAALAAGMDATSNVLAALKLGRQPSGTMAHALVMALTAMEGSEAQAFSAFHQVFPNSPLLIDTFDTIAAARNLAEKFKSGEMQVKGVRIDSGDIAAVSKEVKALLPHAAIFASGDIDEAEILRLKALGAPIDGYGIGTKLVTGVPVNGVYKLVEIDNIPVSKKSSGKQSIAGRKQIWRSLENGVVKGDRFTHIAAIPQADEQPLLELIMHNGELLKPLDDLDAIAKRTRKSVQSLPSAVRNIPNLATIPVKVDIA
ncbi:MAG: nicotinate phosphoribosyltransferase [Pseudanabaena sp. M57BS1SP1A06MG]|nr:nicotinate phosphoribosyltransferase [Pseudanabaena sp. M53BS1SP1A06MG]MCA6582463.1 nicotinate phosphoribosyltransferase [Pseudanabaena sp. M34BS1SP1A06MG]MCA6593994.1 nicotinate phosphoribosyltransferase [Pseudanabaena sp. M38BS1SP1A06MG]MCA6600503.1 nicotinate phosphoribosyltransferase [Pseudanabaena sp. M57BS1SP1A06MG]